MAGAGNIKLGRSISTKISKMGSSFVDTVLVSVSYCGVYRIIFSGSLSDQGAFRPWKFGV
jgi:hypothetical protein